MNLRRVIFTAVIMILVSVGYTQCVNARNIDGPIAEEYLERTVQRMFYQEKFAELEEMAQDLRKTKGRFPHGSWKLVFFYKGVSNPKEETADGWERHLSKLDKWLNKSQGSITARVAAGYAWSRFGYAARGEDTAGKVTEEGWRLLHERTQKALSFLENKPARPEDDCPGRYAALLTIGLVTGWDQQTLDAYFKEAIALEPAYYSFYESKAVYLLPKWHGGEGDWQSFSREATRLTPAYEGKAIYMRILDSLWGEYGTYKTFNDPGVSWPMMKQGFIDTERNFPNSPWNLNKYCKYACQAGDTATARALFASIGDRPYWKAWKPYEYNKCQTLLGLKEPVEFKINFWTETEDFRQLLYLADDGDAHAQFQIGQKYYECAAENNCSSNIPATNREALKWFRKAAEQGYVLAQQYLFMLYAGYLGIDKDLNESLKWMNSAAYQGDEVSISSIAAEFYNRQNIENDPIKAFAWASLLNRRTDILKELSDKLAPQELKQAELEANKIRELIRNNKEAIDGPTTALSKFHIPPAPQLKKLKPSGNLLEGAKWQLSGEGQANGNALSIKNGGELVAQVNVGPSVRGCVFIGTRLRHTRPQTTMIGAPFIEGKLIYGGRESTRLAMALLSPQLTGEKAVPWWSVTPVSGPVAADFIKIRLGTAGQMGEDKTGSITYFYNTRVEIFPTCEEAKTLGESLYKQ